MALIAINAGIGEGKDTFYAMFEKHAPVKFENRKFADSLKEMLALLTGCKRSDLENEDFKNSYLPEIWTLANGHRYTYREALQRIGTELFRDTFHPDTWVNSVFSHYSSDKNFAITDFRFKNEAAAVAAWGGITIKINRYMSIRDWLDSKYFAGLPTHTDAVLVADGCDLDMFVSKRCLIENLMALEEELEHGNNATYKKLTHISEIGLFDHSFDYCITNHSTLEHFEQQVVDVIEQLKSRNFFG